MSMVIFPKLLKTQIMSLISNLVSLRMIWNWEIFNNASTRKFLRKPQTLPLEDQMGWNAIFHLLQVQRLQYPLVNLQAVRELLTHSQVVRRDWTNIIKTHNQRSREVVIFLIQKALSRRNPNYSMISKQCLLKMSHSILILHHHHHHKSQILTTMKFLIPQKLLLLVISRANAKKTVKSNSLVILHLHRRWWEVVEKKKVENCNKKYAEDQINSSSSQLDTAFIINNRQSKKQLNDDLSTTENDEDHNEPEDEQEDDGNEFLVGSLKKRSQWEMNNQSLQ